MSINVKAFSNIPAVTEMNGAEEILVNDGGVAKRMPADMVKGVTSWNDLPDRPFGEKSVVLEWDGDTTDKVVVTVPVGGLYKVYDTVVSLEGLTVNEVITSDGKSVSASVSTLGNGSFGVVSTEMTFIIVAAEDNFETMGQVFPEKGIYFLDINGMFLARCELNDITPIDEKYLPESVKGSYRIDVMVNPTSNGDFEVTIPNDFEEAKKAIHDDRYVFGKSGSDEGSMLFNVSDYTDSHINLVCIQIGDSYTLRTTKLSWDSAGYTSVTIGEIVSASTPN